MKRSLWLVLGFWVSNTLLTSEVAAQGGRGGLAAGGGARPAQGLGGNAGGALAAAKGGQSPANRTPSVSRPGQTPQVNRPSGGGASGGKRQAANRSSLGSLPTPTRPGGGGENRGGGQIAANIADKAAARSDSNSPRGGGRPATSDLQRFLDLPGTQNDARGALAGGAAAQFLRDNPNQLPSRPGRGDVASILPASRPDFGRDRPGNGEGIRPGGDNRPNRPNRDDDRAQQLPVGGNRPNRPGQGGDGERWRPGDRPGSRPDRITDRDKWNKWRNDHRKDIVKDWHNRWHDSNKWYRRDWWNRYGWRYPYYPNFNYWRWAAWPGLVGWMNYGWSQPVYYNYGDNVYYQGDQVYYGDQPVATAAEYAQQAAAIAANVPESNPAPDDWMPLGVFAVTEDGEPNGADPTMFLQLAVSKQGVINGTFQNTATDDAKQVEGMVDKQTQRAAWGPVGKDWPIMETGAVNLTDDTTPALIHFANGTTQQRLLVRLESPGDNDLQKQ